jgi:hypothetical protein
MKNPSLEIIVTERCSTGGCPLEEACEHCYLIQSAISVAISYIISVYCEDYAGYFTDILLFLAFQFCSAYFIYLVSCIYFWSKTEDRETLPKLIVAKRPMVLLPMEMKFDQKSGGQRLGLDFALISNVVIQFGSSTEYPK